MRIRNALIVSLGVFLGGWSDSINMAYLGTTPGMSTETTAVVFWGESAESRRANGVSTHMRAIGPITRNQRTGNATGSDTATQINTGVASRRGQNLHKFDGAVIRPGQYSVGATCVISLRDSIMSTRFDAIAGKRYLVRCKGRTPNTLKLTVQEI